MVFASLHRQRPSGLRSTFSVLWPWHDGDVEDVHSDHGSSASKFIANEDVRNVVTNHETLRMSTKADLALNVIPATLP